MGLFATLTSASSEPDNKSTTTSSSEVPFLVQLYSSNTAPILVDESAKSRTFPILSFQSVRVGARKSTGGALLTPQQQQQQLESFHPNLGVWNVRVTKPRQGTASEGSDPVFGALPLSKTSAPCFGMTVRLANNNLSQVEPTISMLQDALVRYFIEHGQKTTASDENTSATTSLYDLRSENFGLAVNDTNKTMAASADEQDKAVKLSLVISVVIPNSATLGANVDYKDKQAEALVLYHLRKYAASLNAVLCFVHETDNDNTMDNNTMDGSTKEGVGDKDSQGSSSSSIDAISMDQLSHVWHQLAKGEQVTAGNTPSDEGEGETNNENVAAGIYGPGCHQEDLIESVLLRNAQFPGNWDPEKDSLWVALPSKEEPSSNVAATSQAEGGDEPWLSELRSSVTSEVKTPTAASTKGDKSADATKTPNDAAVSSFFESLLKP